MKSIIICILCLFLSITSFGQQTDSTPTLTSKKYLQKSTRQKVGAFILLTAGFATLATISQGDTPLTALPTLAVTGTVLTLGSIPLFIASGKNKRKSREFSTMLEMKNRALVPVQNMAWAPYPALSIKIKL